MEMDNLSMCMPELERSRELEWNRDETWRKVTNSAGVAALSSVVSVSLVQPIDVTVRAAKKGKRNLFSAAGRVLRDFGMRGFFRGNRVQLLRKVPAKAVRVMTYEWSNMLLTNFRSRNVWPMLPGVLENVLVSVFAAAVSVSVTYPLHLAHVCHVKGLNYWSITKRGFFRGVRPLALATIPSVTLELFAYNAMRDLHPEAENSLATLTIMSLAARCLGDTVAHPLKIVSKKIAIDESKGVRKTVSRIVKKNGPMGLFKDVQYKYLKGIISVLAAKTAAMHFTREVSPES